MALPLGQTCELVLARRIGLWIKWTKEHGGNVRMSIWFSFFVKCLTTQMTKAKLRKSSERGVVTQAHPHSKHNLWKRIKIWEINMC